MDLLLKKFKVRRGKALHYAGPTSGGSVHIHREAYTDREHYKLMSRLLHKSYVSGCDGDGN